jgi:hypothetical protein
MGGLNPSSLPIRSATRAAMFEVFLRRFVYLILILVASAFTFLDRAVGISTMTPAILVALAFGFFVALPLFFNGDKGVKRLLFAVAVYAVFAGCITFVRHIDWDKRKTFMRAFARIQPGMTRSQVESLMSEEFRGMAPVGHWTGDRGRYCLDPNDGAFNAEIVFVSMQDDQVVKAEYLTD